MPLKVPAKPLPPTSSRCPSPHSPLAGIIAFSFPFSYQSINFPVASIDSLVGTDSPFVFSRKPNHGIDRVVVPPTEIQTNQLKLSLLAAVSMPSKNTNGSSGQVSHRLRNFFRINSPSPAADKEKNASSPTAGSLNLSINTGNGSDSIPSPKPSRHTKFFSNTVGRLRAHTVASEGNQLDEAMSPTAHANPYFVHQGQPGLRHHNEGSVPPSPPDTPSLHISGPDGGEPEHATSETKEELARRLRRVASAPNAQGMFVNDGNKVVGLEGERPGTAELGKDPIFQSPGSGKVGLINSGSAQTKAHASGLQDDDTLGALPPPKITTGSFRRTYSSNSIKVRDVEVGPSSFDKIKLIGKGDVGKVYLVREKKSNRLYAMKSMSHCLPICWCHTTNIIQY